MNATAPQEGHRVDQDLLAGQRFLDRYYSIDYTRARIEAWSAPGSPEKRVESLRRFRGIGLERITLRLAAWDQVGQLERVIREVLPYVNR